MTELITEVAAELRAVGGVKALALGGSRARGTHTRTSDIDLGIYYDPRVPLDMPALSAVATRLDDEHRPDVVTPIGGWGPWINGGGWLRIRSQPVDFLYRDLEKLRSVIDACLAGQVETFYQPGHPQGFVTAIYVGELMVCRPLWDPDDGLAELKARVQPYPPALQAALIQTFAWEIDFSIGIARKAIYRADVAYAAGCCFRAVMCMLQVLFALNQEPWLNEKGAVAIAQAFRVRPEAFQPRVEQVFTRLAATPEALQQAVDLLMELSADVNRLLPG